MKKTMLIAFVVSFNANASDSSLTVKLSQDFVNSVISKKLPFQNETTQSGTYDVIRGDIGGLLEKIGLGGIDKIPYSVTMKTTINNIRLQFKKNEIIFEADGNVSAKNFSDTETLKGRAEVDFDGHNLNINIQEAIWPIDVNFLGLTGDIPVKNYDLTTLMPQSKKLISIEIPTAQEFKAGDVPLEFYGFNASIEEGKIIVTSLVKPK